MANLTEEGRQQEPQKIKSSDRKWIKQYLKDNFGEEVVFDYDERTLKLCNNEILSDPKFINLLKKFKFIIQPSLW